MNEEARQKPRTWWLLKIFTMISSFSQYYLDKDIEIYFFG
jgi:hypothetical protein